MRRLTLFTFFLLILINLPTVAGPLEDGAQAYKVGNYQQALRLWKPLAEQGNADAQYNLGLLYMNGKGVEKNDRQALFYFLDAARQGHAEAQFNAGLLFATGRGITRTDRDAFMWWERAAKQGLIAAKYNLGFMYAYGRGTGVDYEKAISLWNEAADAGYAEAIDALATAYENGWFGLAKDPQKARQWRDKLN